MSRPEDFVQQMYCKHKFPRMMCLACAVDSRCIHGKDKYKDKDCLLCYIQGDGGPLFKTKGGADAAAANPEKLDQETRLLAAMSYGESSTKNLFEEMAGIASVLVRQVKARKTKTVVGLVKSDPDFSYVVSDKNKRYQKFKKASDDEVNKDSGMSTAVRAARHALNGGMDYSNGAYFWDGADIKTNYSAHAKVSQGIKFSDPAHNIYGIKESTYATPVIKYVQVKDKKTGKLVNTKTERGRYDHVYVSTGAWGGTIFWKLNPDFIKATGNKEYK